MSAKFILKRAVNLILITLVIFNGYYFLIRQEGDVRVYIKKLVNRNIDPILDKPLYKDWVSEFDYLNQKWSNKNPVVLVGDSIIARFKVSEYFPEKLILNRGIYSDTIWGVINRLDVTVNNLDSSLCLLLIGFNDFKYRNDEQIFTLYSHILDNVRARRVGVISLLPVDRNRADLNQRIERMNTRLKLLTAEREVLYVDMAKYFKDSDGFMSPKLSSDGVHPNFQGYLVFREAIERCIIQNGYFN